MSIKLRKVIIFTDGSCLGNPGPGGISIIMIYKNYKKFFNYGFFYTTNNRMELIAVIKSLKLLKYPCKVTINTDSKYVQQGITKWILNWKIQKWKKKNKKKIKNKNLWIKLYKLTKIHIIKWNWIKSHNGNINNEICDKNAKKSAKNPKYNDKKFF
ncbi:ribonuclease HI [Buchnera aphidicola]|uniref:ribonuclease HI n=1 Tax=Buchnera aphidicola TaxID=9 RepID=UPI0034641D7A